MGKKKKQSGKAAPAAVKAAPDYKKYIGLGLIPLAFFAVEVFGWVSRKMDSRCRGWSPGTIL